MATTTWNGPAGTQSAPTSGSYETSTSWSSGTVPSQNDDVVLPFAAAAYNVLHATATPAIHSLWVERGATFSTTASFQVARDIAVDGRLNLAGSLVGGFLYGTGLVSGHGTISSFLGAPRTAVGIVPTSLRLNAVGGTLEIDSPSPFRSQIGGSLTGSGTIDFHAGEVGPSQSVAFAGAA